VANTSLREAAGAPDVVIRVFKATQGVHDLGDPAQLPWILGRELDGRRLGLHP
jgi:hypothetical protein